MIKRTTSRMEENLLRKEVKKKVHKRIVIEGVEKIRIEKVTTTFEIIAEISSVTNQILRIVSKKEIKEEVELLDYFFLTEVSAEEISEYRKKGIPSFVFKIDGKLYHSKIKKNVNYPSLSTYTKHQCAMGEKVCNRLFAVKDEQGGCAKVRNGSKYIEKYDWIVEGYEIFNTHHDLFVVAKCLHYRDSLPWKM